MESRDRSSLLLPLAVLLGMAFPFAVNVRQPAAPSASPAPTPGTLTVSQQESGPSQEPARDLSGLLRQFFGVDITAKGALPTGYSISLVIATAPDPLDSQLPYTFDSSLEAIRQAALAAGFVVDRSYIPWSRRGQASGISAKTPAFRTQPGVLLFRSTQDQRLLAVLLVGETPTAGIHKDAFVKALEERSNIRDLHNIQTENSCEIKVLGPSFSGSLMSLQFVLRRWLSAHPGCDEFKIVSGSATAIPPGTIGDEKAFPGRTSFQATVPYDPDTLRDVWKYLSQYHYCKIALLTEGTSYGDVRDNSEAAGSCQGGDPFHVIYLPFPLHISQLRVEADIARKAQQPASTAASDSGAVQPLAQDGEGALSGMPAAFSSLSVNYAELSLTSLLSTISQERVQAVGILATDARDTIFLAREVRSHAPDTVVFTFNSDLLYLHPDSSPATYGMLVFTPYPLINANQAWSYPFGGSKVRMQFSSQFAIGVYNAAAALLEEPRGPRAKTEKLVEYGWPFDRDWRNPQHAGPPLWVTAVGHNAMAPMTALPRDDSQPYLFAADMNKEVVREPPNIYTGARTFGIAIASLVLLAFAGILVYIYFPFAKTSPKETLDSSDKTTRQKRNGHWLAWQLGDPATQSYWALSRFYLLVCCGALLLLYGLIAFLYSMPAATSRLDLDLPVWKVAVMCLLLAASLLLVLLAGIVLVKAYFKAIQHRPKAGDAPEDHDRVKTTVKIIVTAGCIVIFLLTLVVVLRWCEDARHAPYDAVFSYLRSFNWSGGASPLLPLFLIALAGFLWGFGGFRRLRMIDGMWQVNSEASEPTTYDFFAEGKPGSSSEPATCDSSPKTKTDFLKGLHRVESGIKKPLEEWSTISTFGQIAVLAAAGFLALFFLKRRFLPTFEGKAYDWLFGVAYLFIYGVLAVECSRLWMLWWDLRRFLRRLAQLPLRAAFARYHKKHPSLPKISLATPPPTFTVLAFSVEEAAQLLRLAQEAGGPLDKWRQEATSEILNAQKSFAEALQFDAENNRWQALQLRCETQYSLSKLAGSLTEVMEPYWRAGSSPSQHPAKESEEPDSFYSVAEEFLTGRAVHFVSYVLPVLRNLSAFVLSGLLLMLFAVVCYPFQPQNDFLLFNWIVILSFIGAAMTIFVQMEKDFVMSSLNGTDPGKVNFSFALVFRFLTYGVVPIMVLLGVQFPDALRRVLSLFSSQGTP